MKFPGIWLVATISWGMCSKLKIYSVHKFEGEKRRKTIKKKSHESTFILRLNLVNKPFKINGECSISKEKKRIKRDMKDGRVL